MTAPLTYILTAPKPANHLIHVKLTIEQPEADGQRLSMPAWIPGSYLIRDYARHVVSINAHSGGNAVAIWPIDKDSWQVAPCAEALVVEYQVYAWDRSVRGAHLDETHWYFNGPCVCLEVAGQANQTHDVVIERPQTATVDTWQVQTAMRASDVDSQGFGRYQAASYDELIDHPVEMAQQVVLTFDVCGVPHRFAIRGAIEFDAARLIEDVTNVCTEHHALLGTPADLDRYVFLADASASGYGGLEHEHSTSLAIARSSLPIAGRSTQSDDYRKLLGLISHEYFHLWNVKRLRPAVLRPYPLADEAYTRLLWVFEGITSYYDDLGLVRCGAISVDQYLEILGQQLTRVLRVPGRHVQSVAESSFYAWTKLYKRNENSDNTMVSYYTRGAMAALALDLTLRANGDSVNLDQLMRRAWDRYAIEQAGMPEDGIEALLRDHAAGDYQEFFDRHVYGTEDPDLASLFAAVGVDFRVRPQDSDTDSGGRAGSASENAIWWGMSSRKLAQGIKLTKVRNDGPAENAGLAPGDLLVALDGLRLNQSSFRDLVGRLQPGETVRLTYFRDDVLTETHLKFAQPPPDRCYLTLANDGQANNARERWLASQQ